jgi:hypothetical protein
MFHLLRGAALRVGVALAANLWLPPATAAPASEGPKGSFELITYNVAGLPEGISLSRPLANLPLIGDLLNRYDIALVQEDFAYPLELRRNIQHGFASPPFVRGARLDLGDGLSQFSRLPFSALRRVPWQECHGFVDSFFDCLTPKGFSVTRQVLADGVELDLYNLHMDAGWNPEDRAARAVQVSQLLAAIRQYSSSSAVIIGGDTNLSRRDHALFARLLHDAGLEDACTVTTCAEPGRIDRVLYRSSAALRIMAKAWRIPSEFVDARGEPLSDHLPVAVQFEWHLQPEAIRSAAKAALPGLKQ